MPHRSISDICHDFRISLERQRAVDVSSLEQSDKDTLTTEREMCLAHFNELLCYAKEEASNLHRDIQELQYEIIDMTRMSTMKKAPAKETVEQNKPTKVKSKSRDNLSQEKTEPHSDGMTKSRTLELPRAVLSNKEPRHGHVAAEQKKPVSILNNSMRQISKDDKFVGKIVIHNTLKDMSIDKVIDFLYSQNVKRYLIYDRTMFSRACKFSHYITAKDNTKQHVVLLVTQLVRDILLGNEKVFIDWDSLHVFEHGVKCQMCNGFGHPDRLCRSRIVIRNNK